MKNFKSFLGAVFVFLILFYACEKPSTCENPSNQNTEKLISKIILPNGVVYNYEYDNQNRISKLTSNEGKIFNYDYSDSNRIEVSGYYDIFVRNGKIVSPQGYSYYTYQDDYLTQWRGSPMLNQKELYVWQNELLTSINGSSHYSYWSNHLEYDTLPIKTCNLDLFWLLPSNRNIEVCLMFNSGYFGKVPNNLPSEVKDTLGHYTFDEDVKKDYLIRTRSYRYDTDNENYLRKIYQRIDNGEESLMYQIEYNK